ncbi:hypothetical protein [Streptomyces wuyuanensis]|uniref:hypothetical protein n=1 Tax=Streptomyces wuyuanensis TaxID=1196353 RepID=UPI003441FA1C
MVEFTDNPWGNRDEDALATFLDESGDGQDSPGLEALQTFLNERVGLAKVDARTWLSEASVHSRLAHALTGSMPPGRDYATWLLRLFQTRALLGEESFDPECTDDD